MAPLAQAGADLVVQLGGEGALAHPGGVGLDDAEDVAAGLGPDAGPRRHLAGDGVGARHVGIGAVVDVQQGGLGALEEHPAAGADLVAEDAPGGLHERGDLRRDLGQLGEDVGGGDRRQAKSGAQGAMVGQQALDLGLQGLAVGKVGEADGPAADLVLVGRADAPAGGADLPGAGAGLPGLVEVAVQGQDEGGVVGQDEDVRRDLQALGPGAADLVHQGPGVHHHAVADDAELALHHARGKQGELVGPVAHHDGMAGVVAALEADDDVRAVGQPVDDLALALVAPLAADDGDVAHDVILPDMRPPPAGDSVPALRQALGGGRFCNVWTRGGAGRAGLPVRGG